MSVARQFLLNIIKSTSSAHNIGNGHLLCKNGVEGLACHDHDPNCDEVQVRTLSAVLSDLDLQTIDVRKVLISTAQNKAATA